MPVPHEREGTAPRDSDQSYLPHLRRVLPRPDSPALSKPRGHLAL